jgi:HD superfamily phosphohydrolase
VVDAKGVYSVEKFLMARRFMYWQVYLHKTGLVAEQLLIRVIRRARERFQQGLLSCNSEHLSYFIGRGDAKGEFTGDALQRFARLDDVDVLAALKHWEQDEDRVLSWLCRMILDRQLLSIKIRDTPFAADRLQSKMEKLRQRTGFSPQEASYFVFGGEITNRAYNQQQQNILILGKNEKVVDVARRSDHLNLEVLSRPVTKYYICYPKKGV